MIEQPLEPVEIVQDQFLFELLVKVRVLVWSLYLKAFVSGDETALLGSLIW